MTAGTLASGVLFDFSGTLLRVEPVDRWLRAVLDAHGIRTTPEEFAAHAQALTAAGALPGGPAPRAVPPALRPLWDERDRTGELHRAAYTGLARQVPLPDPRLHDALYERHMSPEAWQPYPDTAVVLRTLAGRGVPVAVVSNIGWDLRPVFRHHGLDQYVSAYVLSYEHGVQKPDARLFRAGCEALGLDPARVLMVGDDARADGGAARIGCAVHLVRHLPVTERPDGLRPVLGMTAALDLDADLT
ncbi:HAD family hydrolase [Streptomyces daliensis]|uniref:HAD-IA family hydrolase n=1 Tax=Streptomyces daliensis TaxID=299421 RepID=A0A8T4IMI7_9ACTN|nr:HAD-IA family hydrolase [Streptomyces daliensis]